MFARAISGVGWGMGGDTLTFACYRDSGAAKIKNKIPTNFDIPKKKTKKLHILYPKQYQDFIPTKSADNVEHTEIHVHVPLNC